MQAHAHRTMSVQQRIVHLGTMITMIGTLVMAIIGLGAPIASAFTNGQAATLVLGQANFVSGTAATQQNRMDTPSGVAVDAATGKVFVVERTNNRVLRFASGAALVTGASAEAVLGQSLFTTNTAATTQTGMRTPRGVAVDSAGRLWVADEGNNRVLRFDSAATKNNGAAADGVLGQANFTTSTAGTSQTVMNGPRGVAVDSAGRLWVADSGSNRVLRFDNAASKGNGGLADGVLGQPNFTNTTTPVNASRTNDPRGVSVDSAGRLWVADTGNNRVLRFDSAASKGNGDAADGVLGQAAFTTNGVATTAAGMRSPAGVAADSNGRLWVADHAPGTGNNRALRFNNAAGKAAGDPADGVLGQTLFTTSATALSTTGLNAPVGIAVDSANNVWIADSGNNRALRYTGPTVPTITWNNPAAITYGTALGATQLNASTGVAGTFTYSPVSGTVLNAGTGQSLSVTFAPTDLNTYDGASKTVTIDVNKANQTITFTNPGNKTYGDPSFTLSANATSGLAVTFSVVSGPATIVGNAVTITGAGSVVLRAAQAGNSNYNAAPNVDHTITINKASLTITADNKTKFVDTLNPALTATYSGFVNGEDSSVLDAPVTLSTTAVTNSPAGDYPITASGAADANYAITFVNGTLTVTPKVVPTITWNNPAAITYGTALSATQLNATASVAGSFSYTPAAGTVLNAGNNQSLNAVFTPTDTDQYASVPVSVLINVNPAPLTITADNDSKEYGAGLPTFTAQSVGLVNGDTLATLDTPLSLNTTALASSAVGNYPITPAADDANYSITLVNGTLTITKAALTITADDKIKYVETSNPTLTASYSGFVNGDDENSLDTPVTLSTTALANSPIGSYPITASGAADGNYTITFVAGTLTITAKLVPLITWNNPDPITYGTALSATQLNAIANVPGSFSYAPTIGTVLDAGNSYTLSTTFTPTDSDTYASVSVEVSIDVQPKALTITADDVSKAYGAGLPTFTATAVGLVNGDTLETLDTPIDFTTLVNASTPVGSYALSPVAADANYTITLVDGTLSVTPALLTITADDKIKFVNTANPVLTASYNGFVNGDDENSLDTPVSLTTTAVTASPVGEYPITASSATDANYTITFAAGKLVVTPKQVPTITWNNPAAIIYGTALDTTQLNATASVAGTFSYAPAAGTVLHAGNSQTLSVIFTPTDSDTYATVSVEISIDVLRKALTIGADNASKAYGAGLPIFTATATGLVNGDTLDTLDTPLNFSTTASSVSDIGNYPISPNAADANYTITLNDGNLSITPVDLVITANDKTKYVGTENPVLTASYNGFVNGDTEASLDAPVNLATTATVNSLVGVYPINASGAADSNYTITYVAGTLTVTSKLVPTISWSNPAAITYGTALDGTQLNATASVAGSLSYTPAAGSILDAGNSQTLSVNFTPSDTGTYASVSVEVSIDVLRKALTITANDATKVYGAGLPTFSANASGLVNGDTLATLDTPLSLSSTASSASDVGTYTISPNAADANYTVSLVDGELTITPAALTITADDKIKRVGTVNPPLTATFSGFVNDDNETSLDTPVILVTTATTGSPVGAYPITASGATSLNYTITFVGGTLAVTAKQVPTISWSNPSAITYGTALGASQLNATADVAGNFSYTPVTGTVLGAGNSQTLRVVFTPTDNVNYTAVEATVTIDVARALLTITADNKTKPRFAVNPALTASYAGFVNGDTVASLATPAALATSATTDSPAGVYAIVVNGAASPNYNMAYVNGTLTITSNFRIALPIIKR